MDGSQYPDDAGIPSIHKKSKMLFSNVTTARHGNDREYEIDKVIDALLRATQVREVLHVTPAEDVATPAILDTIAERVRDPAEKPVWISRDILRVLVEQIICQNAKRLQNYSTAIEICRQLISDCRGASTGFARLVFTHLNSDKECVGVSDCLHQLVNTAPLRSVLIEELGVTKLFNVFCNIKVDYNTSLDVKDSQALNNSSDGVEKNSGSQSLTNFKMVSSSSMYRCASAPIILAQELKPGVAQQPVHIGHGSASCRSLAPPRGFLRQPSNSPPTLARSTNIAPLSFTALITGPPPIMPSSLPSTPTSSPPPTFEFGRPRSLSPIRQLNAQQRGSQPPTPSSSPTLKSCCPTARPFIPALKIPIRCDSVQTLHTRSSRRENGGATSGRSSVDAEFVQAPAKQLYDLAKKLGETYMATDLTALVSFKQAIDAQHNRMAKFKIPALYHKEAKESVARSPVVPNWQASNAYKAKSLILKVLVSLTSQPSILKYIHIPVDILYSELLKMYQGVAPTGEEFKNLLYQLLFNLADYVEYLRRRKWCEVTNGMSATHEIKLRKKLDKFLWHVNNNIKTHMEAGAYADASVHLVMLGEYMRNCPTRAMSAQVVDVCMETLLKMKHLAFTCGKFTTLRLNDLRMTHNMLVVFDELARQNTHAPLNDLLLALFVERDDTLSHVKDYTSAVLFGTNLESEIGRDGTSKMTITDYRVRAINHFEVCVDMIQQHTENQDGPNTPLSEDLSPKNGEDSPNSATGAEQPPATVETLLKKLEFLINPESGYILQFLYLESHDKFAVKKHMLQLLCKIFELKGNPFVRRKSYVDAYISYFYIRFIKLYQNRVLDPPNIEFCQLYLRLLLAFSLCKIERIAMKFYQLKTMDFLVREISLEYEVKLNKENKGAVPFSLSAKIQKTKGKKSSVEFPPPPGQNCPPKIGTNAGNKSEPVNGTADSSSPIKRVSVNLLNLNLKGIGPGGPASAQSDPAEPRKLVPSIQLPSKDQHIPPVPLLRSPVVPILRSPAIPILEDHFATKIKPPVPLLKMKSGIASDPKPISVNPPADPLAEGLCYFKERNNRKLYHAKDLHISFLQLIFSLLLTQNYTLDPLYCSQFPGLVKKLNIPYILHLHINHPQNEVMVSELASATQAMGTQYFRLLKLLFIKLFNPFLYGEKERIATGAYGTVYRTKFVHNDDSEVAVKLMAVPTSIQERCVMHDIFTEILILDKFKNDPRCCRMYDFGVDNDSYWIVMKSYKCSLKSWRLRQSQNPLFKALPLYLNIFNNILNTMQFLVENKVNHFDIKCDNFLIHPKPGISDQDFWSQPSATPNFDLCLADFGESKIYSSEEDGYTMRDRGTECIKSPEMLNFTYMSQKHRDAYDRRKHAGSNSASDVWSIGCLFYELITGEFLFSDDDRFFIRVTSMGQQLLTEEKRAKMGDLAPLTEFLEFIFIRDPFYRPTIRDVIKKFMVTKPVTLQHLSIDASEADTSLRLADPQPSNPQVLQPAQPKTQPSQQSTNSQAFMLDPPLGPTLQTPQNSQATNSQPLPSPFQPPNPQPSQPKTQPLQQSTPRQVSNTSDPPELDLPEHEYFMRSPSQITPFLYVSSHHPSRALTMLRHQLRITHIINCTVSPNAFPDHFEYLHLKLHDENSQDILATLPRVFDFIRDALAHKGTVLIHSHKGISRSIALCIAYVMESQDLTYFEAFLYVRNRRYIAAPNLGFVEQLRKWHSEKRKIKELDALFALERQPPLQFRKSSGPPIEPLTGGVGNYTLA